MRIKNTSPFPDHFLRRMVGWICREYELPVARIREARFTNCQFAFRGRACSSGRILIRIGGESGYPLLRKYPGRVHAPSYILQDRVEALVKVTAHEIAHIERWEYETRHREALIDGIALKVLAAFRRKRDDLITLWSDPPKGRPPKPKPLRRQINECRAREALSRWERKLKLAKTKVASYRVKVRRYDRERDKGNAEERGTGEE